MPSEYEVLRIRRVQGRIIEVDHPELPKGPKTRLNADVAAAGTALTVLDNTGFSTSHLALFRPLGTQRAEIGDITSLAGGTTINLTSGVTFAHSAGEEILHMIWNQVRLYGNSTNTGTGSTLIATIDIDVSEQFTTYINTGTEYSFYFVRPYDSVDAVEGTNYSDGVSNSTGYARNTAQHLIRDALETTRSKFGGILDFSRCIDFLNEGMREIRGRLARWSTLQTYDSILGQATRGIYSVAMPTDIYDANSTRSILGARIGSGTNLKLYSKQKWEEKLEEVNRTTVRTAASANATVLAVVNSYDFNDSGSVGLNLVGYWKLDENTGSTAFDSTTNGYNGAITGATYVTGRSRFALDFDGTDDIVTITDATNIQNVFDTGGSVSFWINPDNDGENDLGRVLEKVWDVHLANQSGSNVEIVFTVPFSGTSGIWSTAVNIPVDTWTHVVITYDADSVNNNPLIYINGTSVTVTEDTTPVGTRTTDVGTNLIIGNNAATTRTFDGTIDEVRFYSRVISSNEVTTLNQNPGGGSHSVSVYVSGVKHTINYTDITYSATVGVLLGVPYSGDGSITVAIAVDLNVWQNEDEGTPDSVTVYDGNLYWWPLTDASNDNKNVYLDFFTDIVAVDSPADTISLPLYDALRYWLRWKLRGLKSESGKLDMADTDFKLFERTTEEMIRQELNRRGKDFRGRPPTFNLTGGSRL